jgi:hypothetical protein
MSDDLEDAETLAGWLGVTGKSVRELAERCMIDPAGRQPRPRRTRALWSSPTAGPG